MKYTKEILEEAVINSGSVSGVLRYFGLVISGSSHKYMKQKIHNFNISIEHFRKGPLNKTSPRKLYYNEVLILDRNKGIKEKSCRLHRALKEYGKEFKCFKCNISNWEGRYLPLEIHHLNHNIFDNRPENLEFICSNCHKQLHYETLIQAKLSKPPKRNPFKNKCQQCNKDCYGICCRKCRKAKDRRKSNRPSKEILIEDIIENPVFVRISKKYKVSDKTIRRWCEHYGLPNNRKDIKKYFK